mgnify:CR=1 FL=1
MKKENWEIEKEKEDKKRLNAMLQLAFWSMRHEFKKD